MRICKLDYCDKRHDSHGYCANHAQQYRRWGRIRSKEEVAAEISDRNKRTKPNLGKKWSEEAKQRQSEKFKGRRLNTGRTLFKKGQEAPNRGKSNWMTNEHKEALRQSNVGRPAWNKGKKWPEMSGANNPAWKGGVKSETEKERVKFRKTMSRKILIRDNYTCLFCGVVGDYMHVDHIKRWADYPELRFEESNCRTLCRVCHYFITFKRKMPEKSKWGIYGIKSIKENI